MQGIGQRLRHDRVGGALVGGGERPTPRYDGQVQLRQTEVAGIHGLKSLQISARALYAQTQYLIGRLPVDLKQLKAGNHETTLQALQTGETLRFPYCGIFLTDRTEGG